MNTKNDDYPIDIESNIDPVKKWGNPHTTAPPPPKNGGLYSGPPSNAPWMPKPVVPTSTYFMQVLLKTANPPPPPGATELYPTENRLGNNYTAMPGVNWYNKGPYRIKITDPNFDKK